LVTNKTPNLTLQIPGKPQVPNATSLFEDVGDLDFEVCLELGIWDLGFAARFDETITRKL
jgi:hypothetical protein